MRTCPLLVAWFHCNQTATAALLASLVLALPACNAPVANWQLQMPLMGLQVDPYWWGLPRRMGRSLVMMRHDQALGAQHMAEQLRWAGMHRRLSSGSPLGFPWALTLLTPRARRSNCRTQGALEGHPHPRIPYLLPACPRQAGLDARSSASLKVIGGYCH